MEPNGNNNWPGVWAESLIQQIAILSNNYNKAMSERRLTDARCILMRKECILVELKAITFHRTAVREEAEAKINSQFDFTRR